MFGYRGRQIGGSAMIETEEEEEEEEVVVSEPASPTGQYLSSSMSSLSIIAVLESEVPVDDYQVMSWLKDGFHIHPRLSSIMVMNNRGEKNWKKVEVKLEDHVEVPIFPTGMSLKSNDDHLDDYLSKVAMEELPKHQPLWEVHIVKYQTSNAAGNVIFKLHHSLGDGFTLMGVLFSCFKELIILQSPCHFLLFNCTLICKAIQTMALAGIF
ncbi:hypothetical protein RCOM_1173910 [Ricinus communis]|uniref:diacylglycerol O-acyltransferase n=1 Tax=Ricinus communis TaxID=3988 RepID=B9RVX7_RICCO|nr:hypothetical protein RCOM_1173910 [Ricinus communis]